MFTSVDQVIERKINDHYFFMSHYAHRVWNLSHKGSIHLYGHSHGSLADYINNNESFVQLKAIKYKCMDIGIDTHKEFRPYHYDEIIDIMKDRVILLEDHHNERTT